MEDRGSERGVGGNEGAEAMVAPSNEQFGQPLSHLAAAN